MKKFTCMINSCCTFFPICGNISFYFQTATPGNILFCYIFIYIIWFSQFSVDIITYSGFKLSEINKCLKQGCII